MQMIPNLEDKVIVVTGAGSGIGAATAAILAQAGARVVAAIKPGSEETLELKPDPQITFIECDVLLSDDVNRLHAEVVSTFGHLDVLVNNAGRIAPIGRIFETKPEEWDACLAVNAGGAFRCSHTFLPQLLEAKGLIINISSGAAYKPLEGWSAYCSSKAALLMLSRAIAHEYADAGLRVFSLGVPPTDTEMQAVIRQSGINPVSKIPRENLTRPEQIGSVVAWLCGPDSKHLKTLEIDVRDSLFTYLLSMGNQA